MKEKIKSILKNKDSKVLIENFLSLSLLQGIGQILPLVTLPYIAKTVGVDNFGSLAFASAVIVFFQAVTDYGFNYTGVRDVARKRQDKEAVSEVLSSIIYARLLLMILSFLILCLCIYFIPQFYKNSKILLYTFTIIPGYVMYPEWFFQGLEKMKYSAIFSTLIKILFTILIFVFVNRESDYIYIPIINGIGFFVVGILAVSFIYNMGYKLKRISFPRIFVTLRGSFDMFISLLMPNLYTNMSTVFLGGFWSKSATGIFDAGNKFIMFSQQVTLILSRTFFPFLARKMDKHSLYVKISLIISLLLSIVLFFGAPLIVRIFYTPEYSDAINVIKIMAISPIFIFLMNVYGTNYLVLHGYERILRNIVIVCSIFGLGLSYVLVSKYSYIGAALAITIVWGIRGVITWRYATKIKKIKKYENISNS